MNPNLIALACQIADSAARSDIECYCKWTQTDGTPGEPDYRHWYDVTVVEDVISADEIAKAVSYLTQRALLVRHPTIANCVSFQRANHTQASA